MRGSGSGAGSLGGAGAAAGALVVAVALASACAERPPAAPSARDRDASAREGAGPGTAVHGTPGGSGSGGGGDAGRGGSGTGSSGDCRARILVVFDRSGSMALPWEGGGGRAARWEHAEQALDDALAPLAARLEIGAILFPSEAWSEPGACAAVDPIEAQIPYRDGASFLAAWRALWAAPAVMGSTPIDGAFERADAALPHDDVVTAVVLLTDGEPTCSGARSAASYAASWSARGISTWVVGLPGAGTSYDDALARAGGTSASISVADPEALTTGLGAILDAALEQACGP